MRKLCFAVSCIIALQVNAQKLPSAITLPNGWKLSPAGTAKQLGDLPLNMVISSKGKYMAVVNCGQSIQSIQLFDPKTLQQFDSVVIARTWYGLAFTADEKKLYASGGHNNWIEEYNII